MAPLGSRQIHSLTPSTPRAPNGPHSKPVPVTTSIDSKVFGELFAGTVTIFVVAVLFWKVGKFIRSFNRHKVLGEGKSPKTRYARTWYGWVSLETHERNKETFRKIFTKLREWTAWKSTRTDYRWVWWDPGQEALEEHRRHGRLLRWLPECFKSYDFMTADEIWNPGPPVQCHGALVNHAGLDLPQPAGTLRRRRKLDLMAVPQKDTDGHMLRAGSSYTSTEGYSVRGQPKKHLSIGGCESGLRAYTRLLRHLSEVPNHVRSLPILRTGQVSAQETPPFPRLKTAQPKQRCEFSDGMGGLRISESRLCKEAQNKSRYSTARFEPKGPRSRNSHRYRVWSAQMQVRARRPSLFDLRDSSGPPGSPMTSILASHVSRPGSFDSPAWQQSQGSGRVLEGPIEQHSAVSRHRQSTTAKQNKASNIVLGKSKYNTVPLRSHTATAEALKTLWQSNQASPSSPAMKKTCPPKPRRVNSIRAFSENRRPRSCAAQGPDGQSLESTRQPVDGLSDWEVRLMDGLDRKLVWMFNELTPGQKPYHFAVLANHWLNRETWLVIDPVSRVSTDCRRQWGDPRFNVPYPEPMANSRPKYPVRARKPVHTSRIDSWRAAVNRQRRVSGVREVVQAVELFDSSAEEPPDGKIDPASWLLPKPPQGYEMSANQKSAWYEGGAGWQEKLEDWQQVGRGYRLHKALHEGRVNRNYVKGVATQVGRRCRSASVKVMPRRIEQMPAPPVS